MSYPTVQPSGYCKSLTGLASCLSHASNAFFRDNVRSDVTAGTLSPIIFLQNIRSTQPWCKGHAAIHMSHRNCLRFPPQDARQRPIIGAPVEVVIKCRRMASFRGRKPGLASSAEPKCWNPCTPSLCIFWYPTSSHPITASCSVLS
jgi:hypothetical protein